jgi:hypothetical protein
MEIVSSMETHIIQVGHIGASIERGRVFSVDGVMATITATCYKGPPLILTNIPASAKLMNKENCDESEL